MTFGPWIERLDAIAVGREVVAVAGRRDGQGVATSQVHVIPTSLLDNKGEGWSLDGSCAIAALALVGDELLLAGGDDGKLVAWDTTGKRVLAELSLGGSIRSLALDAAAARGEAGALAAGTANGEIAIIDFGITNGTPTLRVRDKHAVSDGPIAALAWDPAGPLVAGGADGQLRIVHDGPGGVGGTQVRAVSPGGDGGIRAVACLGDGRAVVGCGDGSIRTCFIVGDVEAHDRSGDHGHDAAVRGLVLAPVIVDDAGREQPRRLFSAGEDGVLKCWFVDGARRPRTVALDIGPVTALALLPGPVAKVDKAIGRLWACSITRKVCALVIGGDADPVGNPIAIGSLLDGYGAALRDGKTAVKVKVEIVARLATIAEDEARVLLDYALSSGPAEARVAATQAMVRSRRRASRPALRAALSANVPELRIAAFSALRELEQEQPIAAIRAGLAASFDDIRVRAIETATPLARESVIAAGLVAGALRDSHPSVRRRAFAALCEVAPDRTTAVRTALARGGPDVRAEALLNLAYAARAADPASRRLIADSFDDEDAGVRTAAFFAALGQRPRLAARVMARVPSVKEGIEHLANQLGLVVGIPADDDKPLDDDEMEPLFAQLACRSADAAIRGAGCLLALGDPRAIGAVLQLTREADPALRRGATSNLVLALAANPDDDRLSARLQWLLDDADRDVRSFAFDALAKHWAGRVGETTAAVSPGDRARSRGARPAYEPGRYPRSRAADPRARRSAPRRSGSEHRRPCFRSARRRARRRGPEGSRRGVPHPVGLAHRDADDPARTRSDVAPRRSPPAGGVRDPAPASGEAGDLRHGVAAARSGLRSGRRRRARRLQGVHRSGR